MNRSWFGISAFTLLLILAFGGGASGQSRMSDKDVENAMKNMQDDTKKFRSSFNSAIAKSTIRNTDQEKQAKNLVEQFEKGTEATLKSFDKSKNSAPGLTTLRSGADQIDHVLTTTPMDANVTAQWAKVKTELGSLSGAYGMGAATTPK